MKTRNGFVSNSSSTSFYINGMTLEEVIIAVKRAVKGWRITNDAGNSEDFDEMMEIRAENGKEVPNGYNFLTNEVDKKPYEYTVVIDSKESNSIPWQIQDFLEYKLGAHRQHWG